MDTNLRSRQGEDIIDTILGRHTFGHGVQRRQHVKSVAGGNSHVMCARCAEDGMICSQLVHHHDQVQYLLVYVEL